MDAASAPFARTQMNDAHAFDVVYKWIRIIYYLPPQIQMLCCAMQRISMRYATEQ